MGASPAGCRGRPVLPPGAMHLRPALPERFVSEWLVFQSLCSASTRRPTPRPAAFPIGGALLGADQALAAAASSRRSAWPSWRCRGARARPRRASRARSCCAASSPRLAVSRSASSRAPRLRPSRACRGLVVRRTSDGATSRGSRPRRASSTLSLPLAAWPSPRSPWRPSSRRSPPSPGEPPTWGCRGELTAEAEYTATAFSKPSCSSSADLPPDREVSDARDAPYYAREVRYGPRSSPLRALRVPPLTRGSCAWRADAGDPAGAPGLLGYVMASSSSSWCSCGGGMSAIGFPLALALHATGVSSRSSCRRPAPAAGGLLASAGARSHLRPRRVGPPTAAPNPRVLFANPAAGVAVVVRHRPALGVVLVTLAVLAAPSRLQVGYLATRYTPGGRVRRRGFNVFSCRSRRCSRRRRLFGSRRPGS